MKLCIYHKDCADGFTAAWVFNKWMMEGGDGYRPPFEFHAADYKSSPPDVTGKEVYILDFSYPRDVLIEMAEDAKSILILDHHKTAMEELKDLPDNVRAVFDMSRSGARLAWDEFFPDEPAPLLVQYVEDRDLWRFDMEGTKEIMAFVFSHEYTFHGWERLNDQITHYTSVTVEKGDAILKSHSKTVNDLIATCMRLIEFEGQEIPLVNCPRMYASDVGSRLSETYPFSISYYDDAECRVYSLRSSKKFDIDVSEIAKRFGGGGHKYAAGFRWFNDKHPSEFTNFMSGVSE